MSTDRSAVEALPTREEIADVLEGMPSRSRASHLAVADRVLALFRGAAVPAPPESDANLMLQAADLIDEGITGPDDSVELYNVECSMLAAKLRAASSRPARPEPSTPSDGEVLALDLLSAEFHVHENEEDALRRARMILPRLQAALRPARPTEPDCRHGIKWVDCGDALCSKHAAPQPRTT
jgi:hypothetical protein